MASRLRAFWGSWRRNMKVGDIEGWVWLVIKVSWKAGMDSEWGSVRECL